MNIQHVQVEALWLQLQQHLFSHMSLRAIQIYKPKLLNGFSLPNSAQLVFCNRSEAFSLAYTQFNL